MPPDHADELAAQWQREQDAAEDAEERGLTPQEARDIAEENRADRLRDRDDD